MPFATEQIDEKELAGLGNGSSHEARCERELRCRRYLCCFWIVTLCLFGASHCIAWNFYFPTTIEQWMWRGAALSLSAYPLLAICYMDLGGPRIVHSVGAAGVSIGIEAGDFHPAASLLGIFGVAVAIAARMFLVLEAFISLRALPASAYEAVTWSSYLPHF